MSTVSARPGASPATLAGIRALSFDLDDTLWDCAPALRHAEETLYGWFERETPRITARHDRASLAAHRARTLAAHPRHAGDVTTQRRLVIGALLEEHGYPRGLLDAAFTAFHRARSEVVLYDGVPEMLERLGRRYPLAAITNGNADLERIGLAGHFRVILAASATVAPKPAPDMFHRCAAELGIGVHEMLHIGDNAVTDVGGALAAGARALWFNGRGERWSDDLPPAELAVDSIAGLVAALDAGEPDRQPATVTSGHGPASDRP